VTEKGLHIGFTAPIDTSTASDPANYSIEEYNYHWTKNYGSDEYSVKDPKKKAHDNVEIGKVTVAPDRKHVFIEVPGIQPVDQMKIKMNLKDENGNPIPGNIGNTIYSLAKEEGQ
jgi:hypothetical protein